jgi:hypothetical protein
MRMLNIFLIMSLISPNFAWAADVIAEEPTIAPLNQGQIAPFPGVLFNKAATAKVIVEYKHEIINTQVEVEKAVADAIAKKNKEIADITTTCEREKLELSARTETFNEMLALKQKELDSLKDQLTNAPNRSTWFGLGFTGGILLTIVTAFAVGQVVK